MLNTRFLFLVGLLRAINSVSAQQGTLSCDDFSIDIATQAEIDFYKTCSEFPLLFFINHTFSGPFELPGVKSVGEFEVGYLGPELKGYPRVEDGVTTISMPDLENTTSNGMLFAYLNDLTSLSFPKLNTISGDLAISNDDGLKTLTLPALFNVTGGVLIDGDFDGIDLPVLKTVAYMTIQSTGSLDCVALGANLSSLAFKPGKFDVAVGFTCWTPSESNRYNSSATTQSSSSTSSSSASSPSTSSSSTSSSSASSTSTSPASPTSSTKSGAGNAVHVTFLNVFLCSLAMAIVRGLVM